MTGPCGAIAVACAVAFAALSISCARAPGQPQAGGAVQQAATGGQAGQTTGQALIAAGTPDRPYELRAPANAAGPLPLVVALHCFGCDAAGFDKLLRLDKLADAAGVLVAIPHGLVNSKGLPYWNATAACCDLDGRNPDDVHYLRAVVEDVRRRRPVDDKRIFAVGVSNGGFLAHRLACDAPDVFTGIASFSGSGPESCAAQLPVAILQIHGDRDEVVPFEGGDVRIPGRAGAVHMPAVGPILEGWRRRDRCQPTATFSAGALDLARSIPGDETDVSTWTCEAGGVALWKIKGGGHVEQLREDISVLAVRWLLDRPRK